MAAACSIFEEDEVCLPTSSGGFKYGLVVESSEYISSDEDEDDENRVQKGSVRVAWHPTGDETVILEKKVILVDRSLMPGDVVRRLIAGKESQRGFIQKMEVKCHVKVLGTDQWIYNVDSRKVMPMQEWDPEAEVMLDSWVGQVLEVSEDVYLRFPDGAKIKMEDADMVPFEDLNDKRKEDSVFVTTNFYPGQELMASHIDDFQTAIWLERTAQRHEGSMDSRQLFLVPIVVEKVATRSLEVRWMCKGFTRVEGTTKDCLETPPKEVQENDLQRMKRLDCFEYCSIQIGDKGFYVVQENDAVMKGLSPRQHSTPDILVRTAKEDVTILGTSLEGLVVLKKEKEDISGGKNQASKKADGVSEVGACSNQGSTGKDQTDTKEKDSEMIKNVETVADENDDADNEYENVDDSDDDSDDSSNFNSQPSSAMRKKTRKRPCLHTKSLKKVKGKRAKTKFKMPERTVNPGDRVPVEVWYTFSEATVMWQDGTVEEGIPSPELFPIHHLDEYEFFPGDYVVDAKGNTSTDYGVVVSSDHRERTCHVKWMKPYAPGKTLKPESSAPAEVSVYDIKEHTDYNFRPGNVVIRVGGFKESTEDLEAVGQVYKLEPEGTMQVWWPNKTITTCYPQDLYIISDEMDEINSTDWSDEDEEEEEEEEGSDISWETENEEEMDEEDAEEEEKEEEKEEKKTVWSESKKKDLDELLQRVQTALTGLLDAFLNVPGPFFRNSKQVFHDILSIFKRCKEMEKSMKSSFFDEPEITELMSEIREQLRKEKTTKLARHVAQLYEYRNNVCPKDEKSDQTVELTEKGAIKVQASSCPKDNCELGNKKSQDTKSKDTPANQNGLASELTNHNDGCSQAEDRTEGATGFSVSRSGESTPAVLQNSDSVLGGATGCSGFDSASQTADSIDLESQTGQMVRKDESNGSIDNFVDAVNCRLESIDDPLSKIILKTSLHSAYVNSTKKDMLSKQGVACVSSNDTEELQQMKTQNLISETCGSVTRCAKDEAELSTRDDTEQVVRMEDVSPMPEKTAQNLMEAVGNSACFKMKPTDVVTLKEQARKKVEEMCVEGMAKAHPQGLVWLNARPLSCDVSVNTSQCTADAGTQTTAMSFSSHKSNQTEDGEETGMPNSHRALFVRVCKALHKRVKYIQDDVTRKWFAYKFNCDENATIEELKEKLDEVMEESHKRNFGSVEEAGAALAGTGAVSGGGGEETGKTVDVPTLTGGEEKACNPDITIVGSGEQTEGVSVTNPETEGASAGVPVAGVGATCNSSKTETDVLVSGECDVGSVTNNTGSQSETSVSDKDSPEDGPGTGTANSPWSGFQLCSEISPSHWFKFQEHQPSEPKAFNAAVRKELKLLCSSLPDGILVKAFEDRMDLFSVMIAGPSRTPYEDGLFAFDVQLASDYPASPPNFHYHSFCSERLNPNLYEDGKVCVSLLGTWSGKGNEIWTNKSNLLQVLVSIQGLILVSEPYFNEAGYEKQRGSQQGQENSRMYNEMAILKLVQSMTKLAVSPPAMFVEETKAYLQTHAPRMIARLETWIEMSIRQRQSSPAGSGAVQSEACVDSDAGKQSEKQSCDQASANSSISAKSCDLPPTNSCAESSESPSSVDMPGFPLLPASKGFCLTVKKHLEIYKNILKDIVLNKANSEALI